MQLGTAMKPTKKKLAVSRETLRSLSHSDLATANGALMQEPTHGSCFGSCGGSACLNVCHSLFDSCYNTQCCLMQP